MVGYIITFRLSNADKKSYHERRKNLYDYFDEFIPSTNETQESTTSTIFWKSGKEFNEIIYDLKKILNKDDELLIIRFYLGLIDEAIRIKDKKSNKDEEIYNTLTLG